MYKDSAAAETVLKHVFLQTPHSGAIPTSLLPLKASFSARAGLSWPQITVIACLCFVMGSIGIWNVSVLLHGLYGLCWVCFMGNALWRLAACMITLSHPDPIVDPVTDASNENLPAYSVIVALYHEAAIVPQLVEALLRIDYPRDRFEILLALEADDDVTIAAFHKLDLPGFVRVIEVPQGFPRTKPRALNYALERATGDLIVIYDAEDRPHPEQLLEAAYSFSKADTSLACLQAPLRPVSGKHEKPGFIARQFSAEYAVQFDVLLPALSHLGLPFPLGGTSNHFKADALKRIGGWDAYNVTEDADLGLRLAQYGYGIGMIDLPTYESPPTTAQGWLPQRTRWIKGYMQTLMVHTRLKAEFRPRVWLVLLMSIALTIGAAFCYAPFSFLMAMSLLLRLVQILAEPGRPQDALATWDLILFFVGTLSGIVTCKIAALRVGLNFGWRDMLSAPFYWCLQSAAALFSLHQLIVNPFHWDKTDHTPTEAKTDFADAPLYEDGVCPYGHEDDHQRHPHHSAHQGLG
ncbi:MAG: glycosyltransferase [Asticcacaulis sp.]